MGIDYDVEAVFGVCYSYDELENFINHPDTIAVSQETGRDNLQDLWERSICNIDCKFECRVVSPYFDADEEHCEYLLGYRLVGNITPDDMRDILDMEQQIKYEIFKVTELYNLPDKVDEISFMFLPNIW